MKEKQKKDKKLTEKGRNELKMLIENFLDRNRIDILNDIKRNRVSLRDMYIVIGNILLPYRYPSDELEDEDTTDNDRINLLFSLHASLVNSRHNRASVFRRNEASTKGSKTILDTSFKTSFSPPFWS